MTRSRAACPSSTQTFAIIFSTKKHANPCCSPPTQPHAVPPPAPCNIHTRAAAAAAAEDDVQLPPPRALCTRGGGSAFFKRKGLDSMIRTRVPPPPSQKMVEAAVFFIIGKGSSSASGLGRQFFHVCSCRCHHSRHLHRHDLRIFRHERRAQPLHFSY